MFKRAFTYLSKASIFKIGVMGSSQGESAEQRNLAKAIGEEIASQRCILITGACTGLPYEAALVAAAKGAICLGFSPAMNLKEHVEKYKFPVEPYILVFTGMEKKGRNIVSIRSCDGVIFIGGRMGTLNEFTIAFDEADESKVIGILEGSGGFSDELFDLAARSGKKSKATIIREKDPTKLVRKVVEKLKEVRTIR